MADQFLTTELDIITPTESLFDLNFAMNESVFGNMTNGTASHQEISMGAIVTLTLLFVVIVAVGIVGNGLVVLVVLIDRKMRQSATNLLIVNIALADLVIMVLGIPEIAMFIMNRGYLLGALACRLIRYLLSVCLYSTIMSLVAVCVERVNILNL